jgi:hypothetical protein
MKDIPGYSTGGGCEIHEGISFAIDDGCPVCEEQESGDAFIPYIKHIEYLELVIKRLKGEK